MVKARQSAELGDALGGVKAGAAGDDPAAPRGVAHHTRCCDQIALGCDEDLARELFVGG
jgi:hypothetical protein